MSAFIVSKEHIDAMVSLGVHGPSDRERHAGEGFSVRWNANESVSEWESKELRFDNTDEIGEMLVLENVKSVSHRYQDNEDLPGQIEPYYNEYYKFSPLIKRPTAVEGLKLIACYEYQSCEHSEWETSEAKRFCEALRDHLINSLPGYNDAPWEYRSAVTA